MTDKQTFRAKFEAYGRLIPGIFKDGSDAEVAQIAKHIDTLGDYVSDLRKLHDAQFDLIAQGLQPARGDTVKRIRKPNVNSTPVVEAIVVENDPLAGEF